MYAEQALKAKIKILFFQVEVKKKSFMTFKTNAKECKSKVNKEKTNILNKL